MTFNLLFLCTGNSARSILGEAIARFESNGRLWGYSAGSFPTGAPNPFAIQHLDALGHDVSFARSKSWDEFAVPDAPIMDAIITVCDSAAGETCPIWPGQPVTAHWGLPDPAAIEGSDQAVAEAFSDTYRRLSESMAKVLEAPIEQLESDTLLALLRNAAP